MKSLVECRQELNAIDDELQELFIKRMGCIREVAFYKIVHELPIYDPEREAAMVERLCDKIEPGLRPYYKKYLKEILKVSKEFQQEIISKSK